VIDALEAIDELAEQAVLGAEPRPGRCEQGGLGGRTGRAPLGLERRSLDRFVAELDAVDAEQPIEQPRPRLGFDGGGSIAGASAGSSVGEIPRMTGPVPRAGIGGVFRRDRAGPAADD
jgi:hypothetical protein